MQSDFDTETLEMASMALNAKISKLDHYPEGTCGYNLRQKYLSALAQVNDEIAARAEQEKE